MMLSKKSSASRWNACRRLSSKSGNSSEFGTLPFRLRRCSHCPAKLLTKADERAVGEHARVCAASTSGLLQATVARGAHQRLVRQAAPEEEREPGRQLDVGDAIRRAGGQRRRLSFRTEDERRAGENAPQAELNAVLERAAALWPAGSSSPDRRSRRRTADDDRPAWPASRESVFAQASSDRRPARGPAWQMNTRGLGGVPAVFAPNGPWMVIDWTCGAPSASKGFEKSRMKRCSRLVSNSGGVASRNAAADVALAGLHHAADAKPRGFERVGRVGRVGLEPDQILLAADRRVKNRLPVERQLELVRILEAANRAEVGAIEPDLELVLAIDRETYAWRASHRPCRAAGPRGARPARDPAAPSRCRCRSRCAGRRRRPR